MWQLDFRGSCVCVCHVRKLRPAEALSYGDHRQLDRVHRPLEEEFKYSVVCECWAPGVLMSFLSSRYGLQMLESQPVLQLTSSGRTRTLGALVKM